LNFWILWILWNASKHFHNFKSLPSYTLIKNLMFEVQNDACTVEMQISQYNNSILVFRKLVIENYSFPTTAVILPFADSIQNSFHKIIWILSTQKMCKYFLYVVMGIGEQPSNMHPTLNSIATILFLTLIKSKWDNALGVANISTLPQRLLGEMIGSFYHLKGKDHVRISIWVNSALKKSQLYIIFLNSK